MAFGTVSVTLEQIGEALAATIDQRSDQVFDMTSKNNAVYRAMKENGNIRPYEGGNIIRELLHYDGNTSYTRYSGYETAKVQPEQILGDLQYDPKFIMMSTTISGPEMLRNSGPAQIIDLVDQKAKQVIAAGANGLDTDLMSDGTADGGKQIVGIQSQISTNPASGTIGGANRADFTFLQHQRYRALTDGGAIKAASNIIPYMNRLHIRCVRGNDMPDVILMSNEDYGFFEESEQGKRRYDDARTANVGFEYYKYKGAMVVPGGQGSNIPANLTYFINTKYLSFRTHKNRFMSKLGGARRPVNQDAEIQLIGTACALTSSGPMLQGILTNS
jgi:hypothetical protein